MESKLNVVVLSHTLEFEQNIVRGARLCYSSADIEELRDKVTPENAEKFLEMILGLGHGSVLEHSSITFGIEGVSRSLTHQLVRHRVGSSYSQKSQRYVKEGQFEYIVPKDIKKNSALHAKYVSTMNRLQEEYNDITDGLLLSYLYDIDNIGYLRDESKRHGINVVDLVNELKSCGRQNAIQYMKDNHKKLYSTLEKRAIENARYILPNACETKIQVTMNVRSLFNFFKERCCDRAQEEIRDMAFEMWKECMKISPTIFKHAVPTCVNGKCKEGAYSCMKMAYYKQKHNNVINEYIKNK